MAQNYQNMQPQGQNMNNGGYNNNGGFNNNGGYNNGGGFNNGGFNGGFNNMPPKPDNNMVLAIITTICCCLPLGIVGIVKASQVNSLYMSGNYDAAVAAANDAKKWSMIGLIVGLVINVLGGLFYGFAVFASMASAL